MTNMTIFKNISIAAAVMTLNTLAISNSQAATITNGFTFSVASSSDQTVGTHYHSNTGGSFGNPAGKAEVGNFFSEQVRGLSEYNLTGLTSTPSAFVSFEIFKAGGLFTGANDFPFTGNIDILAYQGNNLEDISDYQAPSIGNIATFNTAGLTVGNTLSFDITSIFNNAITNNSSSLGIRLQLASGTNAQGGAWTFDNFRLTTTNDTTGGNVSTPEPASLLGLFTVGGLATTLKRKKKQEV